MQTVRRTLWGLTEEEKLQKQLEKCRAMTREELRNFNKSIADCKKAQAQAKKNILEASRRAKNPARAQEGAYAIRSNAVELVRAKKQMNRLTTGKACLESVFSQIQNQINEHKITLSLNTSTKVMKEVNTLVSLPEFQRTTIALSKELVTAGVIEEMINDSMPEDMLMDEAEETEIEAVLSEVLKDRVSTPAAQAPDQAFPAQPEEDLEEDMSIPDEETMQRRLQMLKS